MSDAFTVNSTLNFKTNAFRMVADLILDFERLDKGISSAQSGVGRLSGELRSLAKGEGGIKDTVKALDKMGAAKLSPGLLADLDKVTKQSSEFARFQEDAAKATADTARAMKEMSRIMPARAPVVAGAGGGGAGGAVTPPRGSGGGGHGSSGGFSHHDLLNVSMGASMAGEAGDSLFGGALRAAMEVNKQLAALRFNTGVSEKDVSDARSLADQITKMTPGTTIAENLHTILDAYTVVGNLQEGMAAAPALARLSYVLANAPGAHHGDEGFAAAQAVEIMQRYYDPKTGTLSMEAFNHQIAEIMRVVLGTQGRVQPDQIKAFAKQSRVGAMAADDQFLYRDLPAVLISLGGSRAGTGEAATFSQFVTGRMTKQAMAQLKAAGLIDKKATWQGGMVQHMDQVFHGYNEFGHNPVQWVRDYMLGDHGLLARNKIDPNDKLKVAKFLSNWSGRLTGLGFMAELVFGMQAIDKEGAKIEAASTDPLGVMQRNDPTQQVREYKAAQNTLMVTLGSEALGPAIEGLKALTEAIKVAAQYGKDHPDLARNFTLIGGGISLLATGVGQAAMVLYLGAPFIKGLGALAGVLSPFGAGGAASGALGVLTGGGAGSLAALSSSLLGLGAAAAAAAIGLPPLMNYLAHLAGVDPVAHPGGGKGLQPHGFVPAAPAAGSSGNYFLDGLKRFWDTPVPGRAHKSSYLMPDGGGQQQPLVVHVAVTGQVDGQTLLKFVSSGIARAGTGPSTGTTGYDLRVGTAGGMAGASA